MLDWIPLTEVEGCEINIDAMRLEDVGIYKCFIEHRLQVFKMFWIMWEDGSLKR